MINNNVQKTAVARAAVGLPANLVEEHLFKKDVGAMKAV